MKASASLPFLFLLAAACTDATTAPAGIGSPKSSSVVLGTEPPPPVDAAIAVCTSGGCAVFEGTYMSNGATGAQFTAAITARAAGDRGVCEFPGHASLKINKPVEHQVFDDAGVTSANAQIKCHQEIATGNGTIEIGGVVVNLDQVVEFFNQSDCAFSCGRFTVLDEEGDLATGVIIESDEFDDAYCFISSGEGEDPEPFCFSGEG